MKKIRLLTLILTLVMLFQGMPLTMGYAATNDTIVLYPEFPEKIERDYMYTVYVSQGGEKYEIPVYNSMRHSNHYVGAAGVNGELDRRFCQFSATPSESNPVTVEIVAHTDFNKYTIIPSVKGIASTVSGNKITFNLTESGQYVFRLNDDDYTNVAIFADALETDVPDKNASNVVVFNEQNPAPNDIGTSNAGTTTYPSGTIFYIEEGWHDVEFFSVQSNQQLYIAPGAVLNARVQVMKKQTNVKIFGRGMLRDFNDTRAYNGSADGVDRQFKYILTIGSSWNSTEKASNVEIKDILLFDSKSFNLTFLGADNCTVDGTKTISNEISTDGISFWSSSNITVKNCFLYVSDNALVIGAGSTINNLTMDNLLIGTTIATFFPQGSVSGTHTYTNINVFRSNGVIFEPASGFSQTSNTTGMINIKNLCAIDCVTATGSGSSGHASGKFFSTRNTATSYKYLKTITFENVTLPNDKNFPNNENSYKIHIGIKTTNSAGEVTEYTTAGNYKIVLKNVYAGTTKLTSDNVDFKDYNNNRVTTDSNGSSITVPASSVSFPNVSTSYTPVTKNDTTASYTSYKTYIRSSANGLRVYPSTATFEQDGTVYVSAKSIAKQLGFVTYYDEDDKSLTIYDEHLLIRTTADSNTVLYNDTTKTISANAIYRNDEVMVPYDFFRLINCNASYNSGTKTVVIGNYDRVENLLENGDFEDKYALESWTTSNFTPLTISTEKHAGNYAMRYNDATSFTSSTSYKGAYQYAKNIIAQQGPGKYQISFWAKCNDTDKTNTDLANSVSTINIAGDIISWYPGASGSGTATKQVLTKSWKRYTQDLSVPETGGVHSVSHSVLYAIITVNGASDVSIDDISMVKVSDYPSGTPYFTITTTAANNSLSYGDTGKSVKISAANSGIVNITYETTNDYITLGEVQHTKSGSTYTAEAAITVAYPSNYERTARILAKGATNNIVGEILITIPAHSTEAKHVIDYDCNLVVNDTYAVGDTLDTSALKLTNVRYNDGTMGTVTSGITVTGADFTTAGEKTITVTYDNKTVTYTTTVEETTEPDIPNEEPEDTTGITVLGANIRLEGNGLSAGIRFGAKLSKGEIYDTYYPTTDEEKKYVYDESNNYQFGVIMLPKRLVTEGSTVIEMYENGDSKVLDILGRKVFEQNATTLVYTGVLTEIPKTVEKYTETLQCAFYVRVRENEEAQWQYTFSNLVEDSYFSVAEKAHYTTYNYGKMPNPTAAEKATIDALLEIIDFVEEDLWIDYWA